MEILEQAEHAARLLSQQQYQGYSRWCVETIFSKTFENGQEIEQTESIRLVATTGGIGRLKLKLEEAVSLLAELDARSKGSL